ncbi:MAG: hypothetical protein PHF17_05745 [Arcobacteraceae bacterium]|nr:hypothetical protein [Arcobacteraceae bacterium]
MNIYIYGSEKFKNNIKSILNKANLGINIEVLNTLFAIKTKLENSPKDIFIIDETKIITTNFLTRKMKFLFPSDGIEREQIEKFGVGDVCFNSINGMIGYINSRIKLHEKETQKEELEKAIESIDTFDTSQFKNVYEDDDYEYKPEEPLEEMILEPEIRDLSEIKSIDEIRENEVENEMFMHLKN